VVSVESILLCPPLRRRFVGDDNRFKSVHHTDKEFKLPGYLGSIQPCQSFIFISILVAK